MLMFLMDQWSVTAQLISLKKKRCFFFPDHSDKPIAYLKTHDPIYNSATSDVPDSIYWL